MRAELPGDVDVVAFQCRNPIHRAHYELFTRALDDPMMATAAEKKTITKKLLQELRNRCRDHYNVVADGTMPEIGRAHV